MLVLIRGTLTDVRQSGDNVYSYVYDNSSEPMLYRVKGEIKGELGKIVTAKCRVNVFKEKLYLTLEKDEK